MCVYILSDVTLYDKLIGRATPIFEHTQLTHSFSAISFIRLFVGVFFVIVIDVGVGMLQIGIGREENGNGNENDIHHYFSVLDYSNF